MPLPYLLDIFMIYMSYRGPVLVKWSSKKYMSRNYCTRKNPIPFKVEEKVMVPYVSYSKHSTIKQFPKH